MAPKKPGLIIDVLSEPSAEGEAPPGLPPEDDEGEEAPPRGGGDAQSIIAGIRAELDRLSSVMDGL